MSKPSQAPFALHTWGGEATFMTRKPSWMSRRGSTTHPPVQVPVPPLPSVTDSMLGLAEAVDPPCPPAPASQPAPPVSEVDLSTSVALARLADENASLRGQVAEMASAMARLRRQVLEASEGELVNLAVAVAERVVGRELSTDPTLVVAWAREAIEALAAKDEVVIAVAKDVSRETPAQAWDALGIEYRLQTDAQLPPGSVEVRTPEGAVATSANARLSAVAQALGTGSS